MNLCKMFAAHRNQYKSKCISTCKSNRSLQQNFNKVTLDSKRFTPKFATLPIETALFFVEQRHAYANFPLCAMLYGEKGLILYHRRSLKSSYPTLRALQLYSKGGLDHKGDSYTSKGLLLFATLIINNIPPPSYFCVSKTEMDPFSHSLCTSLKSFSSRFYGKLEIF